MEYSDYNVFVQSVAEADLNEEVGQHELLEDFNFGVQRKHIAVVGGSEVIYQVYDKIPFHAWEEVTEDYTQDFESELEKTIERYREDRDDDPRDYIANCKYELNKFTL